jgi:hypothetical protein
MKRSAISAFQATILIGLGVQVVILVAGVIYFSFIAGTQAAGPSSFSRTSTTQPLVPHYHPLRAMIQSFADPTHHNPEARRNCFSFTSVPAEIDALLVQVRNVLGYDRFSRVIDCIHLNIPHRSIRFGGEAYPKTEDLMKMVDDPRIIIHRLFDYGPMTRYIGPLSYERHDDTSIVIFDIDSSDMIGSKPKDLVALFHAARFLDKEAMWCLQGENFLVENGVVAPKWDTFPSQWTMGLEWNLVHFCRGVGGLLFKPKQFKSFWYKYATAPPSHLVKRN